MRNQVVAKAFVVGVVILMTVVLLTMNGPLGCSSGSSGDSDDDDDTSSDDTSETFSNGGVTLTAELTDSGSTKTTRITNSSGETVVTAEVTVNGVTLTFPGQDEENETTFSEPLDEVPSNHAVNMLATFIAGQLELDADASLRPDSPGCDWFPDTQCTLGCCADHDECYDTNGCGASSWLLVGTSAACINCNGIAEVCILRACSGVDSSRSDDRCYDNRCHQFYDCGSATCECTKPCDSVSPSNCGNGTCEVDEDSSNCSGDCSDGSGLNQCCVSTSNCPSELPESCPGSCCCCGLGEVCSSSSLCSASGSLSSEPASTLLGRKWGPAVGDYY